MLTIELTKKDWNQINANQQLITLVASFADSGSYVVVCQAFAPVGSSYTLSFDPVWSLFASQQPIAANTCVQVTLTQAVTLGNTYTFTGSTFQMQGKAFSPTVIGLNNQSTSGASVVVGLSQQLAFNGTQTQPPLTIASAPYNEVTYFQPQREVLVFVATTMQTGLIIPAALLQAETSGTSAQQSVPLTVGKYLAVSLATDVTIYFDAANNCFTTAQPTAAPSLTN